MKNLIKNILLIIYHNLHYYVNIYYYKNKVRKNANLWKLVQYFNQKSNSTGVGHGDIYFLYNFVKTKKPKSILEFSTGASTAYLCLAIKETQLIDNSYNPIFYSLENSHLWIEHQKKIFPKELSNFVKILKSNISLVKCKGQEMVEYLNMPDLAYEMIHVDGPNPNETYGNYRVKNTIDIINKYNHDCTVVFDNRIDATKATINNINNEKYIWDRTISSFLIGHNIIRKKL